MVVDEELIYMVFNYISYLEGGIFILEGREWLIFKVLF